MKKTSFLVLVLTLCTLLCFLSSCETEKKKADTTAEDTQTSTQQTAEEKKTSQNGIITIKPSPDKYTWYIKNYVGKNCASFGYTSLSGNRMDEYGKGYIKLIFVSSDGTYVDVSSAEALQEWVVTGQSLEPNTELKLTFDKDSDGVEYENLIDRQNIDEIVLTVKKAGDLSAKPIEVAEIKPSPDKYTLYIKDYAGMNCASFGYTSLSGNRMDEYGKGYIKLIFVSSDGTYVDVSSAEALQEWVVTGQNIAPNTELKLTFDKDSDGVEYQNLIDRQNIDEIVLSVRKVGDSKAKSIKLTKINASPDKYTLYIKDYAGMNCASFGYTSLSGNRMDEYGKGYIKLIFVSSDGTYVDVSSAEALQEWVVTGQNIAPNTELKLTFDKDSDGVEYQNLIDSQTFDEIELYVEKVNK